MPLDSTADWRVGREVNAMQSIMRPAVRAGLAPHVQSLEDQGTSALRGLPPPGLGFFGMPLWSCDCAASQGPFGKVSEAGRNGEYYCRGDNGRQPLSAVPLPPALFLPVALFLAAEDVEALASVCKSLRWLAFNRQIWKSLCFSEKLVSHSMCAAPKRRFGETVPKESAAHLILHSHSLRGHRIPLRRSDSNYSRFCVGGESPRLQAAKQRSAIRITSRKESFSRSSELANDTAFKIERCDTTDFCSESVKRGRWLKPKTYPESDPDVGCEMGIQCRGLQVLPGYTLEELVDWRFLFLLNRVSPGPKIYVRVRELELQFPFHPVVPDLKTMQGPATRVDVSLGEGQTSGCGETEKERQARWGITRKWPRPHEFVSIFIQRAINIRRPMRLRHLRQEDRPGLCVTEILRGQRYLLEWQVLLRCLLVPSSQSAVITGGARSESFSTMVWPLPPYGILEGDSLVEGGRDCWSYQRSTIYSLDADDRLGPFEQTPQADAEHEDMLFHDVLDSGCTFATLLSPLAYGRTAVAIVVGAVLVAVATASTTAAITTAAAATATLAARHSRIFRVDLHVIERDEHEDDQEEGSEYAASPTRLATTYSGSGAAGAVPAPASAYDLHSQIANEAVAGGHRQPRGCVASAVLNEARVGGLSEGHAGSHLGPVLPFLQRLVPARIGQLLRSSTLASIALTEASLASAATILMELSRDALITASTALAAAGAAFTAVLLPPGATVYVAAGDSHKESPIFWVRRAGKKWLSHRVVQLTAPLGLQQDAEVTAKAGVLVEQSAEAKLCLKSLQQSSIGKLRTPQQLGQFRHSRVHELRRRGASHDSALASPSLAVSTQVHSPHQSVLPACNGRLGTLRQQCSCSMRMRVSRSAGSCDGLLESEFADGSGPLAHRSPRERTSASTSLRSQPQRSSWLGETCGGCACFVNSMKDEHGDGSSREHANPKTHEGSDGDAMSTVTLEAPEQNLGILPPGWRLEGTLAQPSHGLLIFVRVHLPSVRDTVYRHGIVECCGGVPQWDALAAASSVSPPEDVPLLLPTDATASDLLRLLFLTLAQRNYMLPLVAAERTGTLASGSHLPSAAGRSLCRRRSRRRGRSSSPTQMPVQALMRFWLPSTPLMGEHSAEQPLPSAKLIADLRLMSCERLSLVVQPFALGGLSVAGRTRCLTLFCGPSGSAPQVERAGLRRGSTGGVEHETALDPCNAPAGRSTARRLPAPGLPWSLLPRSIWAQDATLGVVMDTPVKSEPIAILRREANSRPLNKEAESHGLLVGQRARQHRCYDGFPTPSQSEIHGNDVGRHDIDEVNAVCSPNSPRLGDTHSTHSFMPFEQPEEGRPHTHNSQAVQQLHSRSFSIVNIPATPDGSHCSAQDSERSEGIFRSEEGICKPWILRASLNTRQFEYHPQQSNVMLTGGNDGTVSLLDWERDVTLGTKLVDSHQILGLSWLKHHPELFVCAAGVSGIPYVVRWREQDDSSANDVKDDRTRMPTATMPSSSALPDCNTDLRHSPMQHRDTEVVHCEADDETSAWDCEFPDGSAVAAALTWFRRYGRGRRVSRHGAASLRIVHQYCACEELSSVSVNSTDDYLLVSGRSPDLLIHDVATGVRLGTLSGLHSGSINIVRFAHNSPHLFVTASFDQTCRLWDLRQRIRGPQPLLNVDTGSLSVMCCFDDSDEWLLCSGVDAALRQVCLRSSDVYPESFAIPSVNAETNFRRAVYLQGGKEFITAGTEEGFFRVFSRLGRDLGVVSMEGMLRPFARHRFSQGLPALPVTCDLLNLRVFLRSHVALGLSAVSDAAFATAAGVSRSSMAVRLRSALRHLGGRPPDLFERAELLDRMRHAVRNVGVGLCISPEGSVQTPAEVLQEDGGGAPENCVEEYVQSLRAHPQERRLVGALLAAKDRVETATRELSFVAMSRLPSKMLS